MTQRRNQQEFSPTMSAALRDLCQGKLFGDAEMLLFYAFRQPDTGDLLAGTCVSGRHLLSTLIMESESTVIAPRIDNTLGGVPKIWISTTGNHGRNLPRKRYHVCPLPLRLREY